MISATVSAFWSPPKRRADSMLWVAKNRDAALHEVSSMIGCGPLQPASGGERYAYSSMITRN